ncbi:helix-turn-helix domain-containing protein [Afipia felis]|uniref:Helix-turn-helix domain-containing protein n=2 Tax=Afipia felis TaxID=1035 RepID=A0A380WE70_AFIFE|nr:helix-turn-helix domain-containing protein [Afipia felis]EKS29705.1 hypothetical protein HMPREF9697_02233 [Afipia felis ATCC 53690]SUU78412.1 Uncharacterised protein [Afipia felis]SUU86477.1 Uncharacterised protein [Afipia felis]
MSFLAVRWALDLKGLSATEKLVLIAICDRANQKGECWPSQKNTAERCGLTERTVNSALKSLEKNCLIRRRRRIKTSGSRTSDLITILAPDLFGARKNSKPSNQSQPENASSNHVKEIHPATRNGFGEIYHDEYIRLNTIEGSVLLEFMPDYSDPKVTHHNETVAFAERLYRESADVIDWDASGIDRAKKLTEWRLKHGEVHVWNNIIRVVQRFRTVASPEQKISSWKYFEPEILKADE